MTTWRSVGTISVKDSWQFTTFIYGEFIRLNHNSDDDGAILAFFDFPSKGNILFPRKIFARGFNQILEIPRFPFSQACIGIKGFVNVPTWRIKVEVGKLDSGNDGYPQGSNFSDGAPDSGNDNFVPGGSVP